MTAKSIDTFPVFLYNVFIVYRLKESIVMQKTSIRFFENIPVRTVWEEETSKWLFCAVDAIEALTKSKNPRVYWSTIKRRNNQLIAICKQLKLKAKDGKFYNTDVRACVFF